MSIDSDGGFITTTGRAGRPIRAAFEDVRSAPRAETLSDYIQTAIDLLDDNIESQFSTIYPSIPNVSGSSDADQDNFDTPDNVPEHYTDQLTQHHSTSSYTDTPSENDNDNTDVGDFTDTRPNRIPELGARVQVYWPLDNTYYSGEIKSINEKGLCTVRYDDEEEEHLDMSNETWRYEQAAQSASENITTLESNDQVILAEMLEVLGQRPFLYHHAQSFEQAVMVKAYQREESQYLKHVNIVSRFSVPKDANIISSHVVYRLKLTDEDQLKLKARIAPHGNEDSDTIH